MDEIKTINIEKCFPQLLEIPDAPKKLYARGTLPNTDAIFLTVVGSRKYTSYGKDVCEKIISELSISNLSTSDVSRLGIVIISGLALGIDAIAHRAALKSGLKTIAIPGSGLNSSVLYPASNHGLANKIVSAGGALLSEFEPDFRATPYSFPQRNRIMAGMSRGILVIEAGERSGTLITARLATEYNRDVFVVPGSIFSPQSRGSHQLLKLGAIPVTCGADILEHWGLTPDDNNNNNDNKRKAILRECSDEEKQIFELLHEPTTKEELMQKLDMPTHNVNITLSVMEIKGLIVETHGEMRINV